MPDAATHPSPQDLAAFGSGRLADAAAIAVASHLEGCPACREAVESAASDSFVVKVRAAKPGGSSLPPGVSPAAAGARLSLPKDQAASPSENLPPELANHPRYRIVRELGRGGMGVVYQAVQTLMDRTVAVKVINPSVLEHRDSLARFQAEVKTAARLDHANIVRAYDADQVGALHLLVMEFVQGMNLADLVQQKGLLSIAHACHFVRQAALGLQHAFEQGMVHRDIKPQNLMVTSRGVVKILDFGLARLRSERTKGGGLTEVNSFMGTPEYVSPEQATDARTADIRADLYSLGCTLYFLLTGRPPFQEDTVVKTVLAQIEKEPQPLHEVRPDVPAELSAVVARLLAKDSAQRFQTPVELAQALVPFIKAGAKAKVSAVAASRPPVASASAGTSMGRDTSKMPEPRKEQGEKPAGNNVAMPEGVEPLKDLASGAAPAKRAKKTRTVAKPSPGPWYRGWRVLAGVGSAVLILGLVGLWAAGLIKVTTPNGTIVLANVPPDAQVKVEGPTVTMTRNGEVVTVTAVSEGPYQLKVVRGGQEIWCSGEVKIKLAGDPIRLKAEPRDAASPVTISPIDPLVQQAQQPVPDKETRPSTVDRTPCFIDGGPWRVQGDELVQTDPKPGFSHLLFGDSEWDDYDFSVDTMCVGGEVRIQLALFVRSTTNFYLFGLFRYSCQLEFQSPFKKLATYNVGLVNGIWYTVRVRVRGNLIQCFLKDGDKELLLFNFEDDGSHPKGRVGLRTSYAAFRFKNIRVTAPDGKVLWEGVPDLPGS
jgi:serine/threonine protein kinase